MKFVDLKKANDISNQQWNRSY